MEFELRKPLSSLHKNGRKRRKLAMAQDLNSTSDDIATLDTLAKVLQLSESVEQPKPTETPPPTPSDGPPQGPPKPPEPKPDKKVWKDRCDTLGQTIDYFEETLEAKVAGLLDQEPLAAKPPYPALTWYPKKDAETILTLVKCLKRFAAGQFEYFFDGFGGYEDYKQYQLNLSKEFPPEYVFNVTLNQIAEDFEVIRRITDQRLSASPDMKLTLAVADALAWRALLPMIQKDILPKDKSVPDTDMTIWKSPTVMTYFQKSPSIRVIPYAPIALIGIPFTAITVPRDLLAIPHEMGHYVYRHGRLEPNQERIPKILGKRLLELDEPSPRWVRRWKEEVFADVYGCLVGGPITAQSFRDLALQSSRLPILQTPGEYLYGQLTEDDGVHPVPVVRPYVYHETLRRMNDESLYELANRLDADWGNRGPIKQAPEFRTRYASSGVDYISVEDGRQQVRIIIREVLKLLPKADEAVWARWSEKLPDGFKVYDDFEKGLARLVQDAGMAPKLEMNRQGELWQSWIYKEKFFPGLEWAKQPPPKNDAVTDPGRAHRIEELEQDPRYTWNHVFLAGGWATKLPGASGANGILFPRNWRGGNEAGGAGGGGY
jgi:hypothetical protein